MFENMKFISSTPVLRMVHVLARDPSRWLYQREVAREAGVSLGSANRGLRELAERGIVLRERRGKVILYRLDLRSPVARQLKVLVNVVGLDGLVAELRPLCKRVILFGSCAEGTDGAASDVDLFVLTGQKAEARRLVREHGSGMDRRLSPLVVDAVGLAAMRARDAPLYERVMRGVTLWQAE